MPRCPDCHKKVKCWPIYILDFIIIGIMAYLIAFYLPEIQGKECCSCDMGIENELNFDFNGSIGHVYPLALNSSQVLPSHPP